MRKQNLEGKIFGSLTVLYRDPNGSGNWICECECGNIIFLGTTRLINRKEPKCKKCRSQNYLLYPNEYRSWCHMKDRCYNKNNDRYKDYGEKGIYICERWHNFLNFLDDLGPKPSKEYTIERINNNGNYEPTNCIWATRIEQAKNRKNNVFYTYNGETHILKDWAKILSINYSTLKSRLKIMSFEEAIK